MGETKKVPELMAVLDYVLNRCTLREIDALEAAVERRRRDLSAQSGIISLDPSRAARSMSETVQKSINSSMDSIRGTFRQFAVDTIRKEAPELTEEQMEALVDSWIPENMAMDASGNVRSSTTDPTMGGGRGRNGADERAAGNGRYTGLVQKGRINGVPAEAMREMVYQFVAYSTGAMSLQEEASLREAVGDWTAIYWKKFPREIQGLVRDFLSGAMHGEQFESALAELLQ
jgi:hypothetical protein